MAGGVQRSSSTDTAIMIAGCKTFWYPPPSEDIGFTLSNPKISDGQPFFLL